MSCLHGISAFQHVTWHPSGQEGAHSMAIFCCSYAWTQLTTWHCICSLRLSRAQPQPIPMLTESFSDCQTSFPSLGLPVPVTTCLSIRDCQK